MDGRRRERCLRPPDNSTRVGWGKGKAGFPACLPACLDLTPDDAKHGRGGPKCKCPHTSGAGPLLPRRQAHAGGAAQRLLTRLGGQLAAGAPRPLLGEGAGPPPTRYERHGSVACTPPWAIASLPHHAWRGGGCTLYTPTPSPSYMHVIMHACCCILSPSLPLPPSLTPSLSLSLSPLSSFSHTARRESQPPPTKHNNKGTSTSGPRRGAGWGRWWA